MRKILVEFETGKDITLDEDDGVACIASEPMEKCKDEHNCGSCDYNVFEKISIKNF